MSEMTLQEAIYTQRAIRRFTDAPVSDEDVMALLDAAVRAPSGHNRQPWHFVVLRDPARKAVARDIYLRAWKDERARVAELAKTSREAAATVERWKRDPTAGQFAQNLDKVPVIILPCLDMRAYSSEDDPGASSVVMMNSAYASIFPAVQNLLLTARARNLGAVLTTRYGEYEDDIKRALGIPTYMRTTCMIPVGHPAEAYGRTRRVPAKRRAHFDGWHPELAPGYEPGKGGLRVADWMTANPVTCSPEDLVYDAQALMQEKRIRQLPVVEDGKLVGILTNRDVRSILLPPDVPERIKERFDLLRVRRVRDSMTREPITVTPEAAIEDAAELMRANKVGGLPVLDGEWLVGIISNGDLLRGMLGAFGDPRGSVRFSVVVSRGENEAGISVLIKELEDRGMELLSVVSEADLGDPHGKIHYIVRVGKADPEKIAAVLAECGMAASGIGTG